MNNLTHKLLKVNIKETIFVAMTVQDHTEEEFELFEHHQIVVDPGQEQLRIDKYVMAQVQNATRNKVQNAIKNGFVTVNGEKIKANYKVRPSDKIIISFPTPPRDEDILPEDIPLNIVYEDDHLLVVNKEAGMVVHPAYNNWTGTLVNALVYHFDNLPTSQNGVGRPGLVHRIDKDTSGLLVITKTEEAMTHLAAQFFNHTVERTYHALVWGIPQEEKGTINQYVGRSLKDRRVMTVIEDESYGKHAITHYELLENFGYTSLIKCNLETGRTHQIRTHLKYLGHPLFNDAMYGGDKIITGNVFTKYKQFVQNCFNILPRQALHAKTLGFEHPGTGKWMQFESEIPTEFEEVLEKWRVYAERLQED